MASRLTTNQEIAGSTPAVVILFYFCPFRGRSQVLDVGLRRLDSLCLQTLHYVTRAMIYPPETPP